MNCWTETTWRIIREAKGIAGWVAVSAVLGILAVLCSIAAPEILGNLIQKLYDFGLSDRQTPSGTVLSADFFC